MPTRVNNHCFADGGVVQEPFPSVREPKVHRPVVGNSLTLQCKPPYGYPEGIVYWGEFKSGEKLKPIENTERVSLDYEGTFHLKYHFCSSVPVTRGRTWRWI